MNHDTIRLFEEGHGRKTDTTNIMRESKKMAHLLFLSPFAARSGLMHSRDNFNFWRHSNSTTQFLYHTIFLLYGYYISYNNIIVIIIWEKYDIGAWVNSILSEDLKFEQIQKRYITEKMCDSPWIIIKAQYLCLIYNDKDCMHEI